MTSVTTHCNVVVTRAADDIAVRARRLALADTARLLQLAREGLAEGVLPDAFEYTTLGGPSAGADCRLCGRPIEAGRPEIEVQWAEHAVRRCVLLHPPCHAAWRTLVGTRDSLASGVLSAPSRPRGAACP